MAIPRHINIHGGIRIVGVIVDVFIEGRPLPERPPVAEDPSTLGTELVEISMKFIIEILGGIENLIKDGSQIHIIFVAFHTGSFATL
jgi:hypothetical protein